MRINSEDIVEDFESDCDCYHRKNEDCRGLKKFGVVFGENRMLSEELDVCAKNEHDARQVAQVAIDTYYQGDLHIIEIYQW